MKRQLFVIPLFLFVLCFIFSSQSFAYTCNGGDGWNATDRSYQTCFFGFSSPEEMNQTIIQTECLDNSNLAGGFCRGITTDSTTITGYTSNSNENSDPPAGQTDDGLWYACREFEGINRAVGKLQLNFTFPDGSTCSTDPVITQPSDWDPATEGMPWQGRDYPVDKGQIFCVEGDRDSGIMTAIGCINTANPNAFISSILKVVTGIAGGIALALILYGVFVVTTSAGIPDKLKAGSEIITSAVIGLIFILLSVVIMNIIGINILGLPGLS